MALIFLLALLAAINVYYAFNREIKYVEYTPGWISVEDDLPDYGEMVMTFDGKRVRYTSVYFDRYGNFVDCIGGKIDYWMPNPKPPKPLNRMKEYLA